LEDSRPFWSSSLFSASNGREVDLLEADDTFPSFPRIDSCLLDFMLLPAVLTLIVEAFELALFIVVEA
jgi:hypothetical protein